MSEQSLGRWPVRIEVPVAWGDMDAFAHVNNTVYLRWFESGRIAYFDRVGMLERMKGQQVGPILGRATIDFRIPLTFPDRVRIEATVLKIGNTSFTMGYRVSSEKHGGVAAEGEGIIVMMNYATGEKVRVDDGLREALARLEATPT